MLNDTVQLQPIAFGREVDNRETDIERQKKNPKFPILLLRLATSSDCVASPPSERPERPNHYHQRSSNHPSHGPRSTCVMKAPRPCVMKAPSRVWG
ncbi:unnamed protein product [Rhodiola kirilowii]